MAAGVLNRELGTRAQIATGEGAIRILGNLFIGNDIYKYILFPSHKFPGRKAPPPGPGAGELRSPPGAHSHYRASRFGIEP